MRENIDGKLVCHRYANYRRGGGLLGRLLLDSLQPLPPTELWCIESATEHRMINGEKQPIFFKMKRGTLPKCLERDWENYTVHVRANVERWKNGLGGYMSRVELAEVGLASD